MLLQYQMADSLANDTSVDTPRCFAVGATMAESFNCIEILANKCAAKFVNKSTSQPARRILPTAFLPRAHLREIHDVKNACTDACVCVCMRPRIEIRNALKCSPVSHEAPPHPYSAVSHATEVATISAILAEGDANSYSDTWCSEKIVCSSFAACVVC